MLSFAIQYLGQHMCSAVFTEHETTDICILSSRMDILDQWLWKEEYWLPPGFRWEDMREMERAHCPLPRDLVLSLPIAFAFISLRYIFER